MSMEEDQPLEVWETDIRSDMWTTMDSLQLNRQLQLITDKIGLLNSLQANDPTILTLRLALERAYAEVSTMLTEKIGKYDTGCIV